MTTRPSAPSATTSWPTSPPEAGRWTSAPPGVLGGAAGHARLPPRGRPAGRPHPRSGQRAWKRAANDDGTFKTTDELRGIYEGQLGLQHTDDIIAYYRIGERSSHTWFVLSQLPGFPRARNYDGSWVEWGNLVRVPIERTAEPGPDPRLKAAG